MQSYINNRFHNIDPSKKPKGLAGVLKWKLISKVFGLNNQKGHQSNNNLWPDNAPIFATDLPPMIVDDGYKVRVSFVGHMTFLLQLKGINILTDPVWSNRASPFSFIGPKRVSPPGINFNDLPKIDVILISHNHYDHLDIATLKYLCKRDDPLIITPLMNDKIIKRHIKSANITTLDWLETSKINDQLTVCLESAQHWSARGLFDKNKALWGSFVIKIKDPNDLSAFSHDICFIGDTGYSKELFETIGNNHNIALSLIPIGAYEPRWFMQDIHINPEEATLIHQHLKSKISIASHFDTFQLADEGYNKAPSDLITAKIKYNIKEQEFITPGIGQHYWYDIA